MYNSEVYAEGCGCSKKPCKCGKNPCQCGKKPCGCEKKQKEKMHEVKNPMDSLPLFPSQVEYGQAYVPYQENVEKLYTPETALACGTVFPELDKPYVKKRGCGCE